ncbi:hypothetical protein BH23THE1_BH23THE1_11820 [soil metagenome]
MVICENDFTIARRSNSIVECQIMLEGYLNLLLNPNFESLISMHILFKKHKNEVHRNLELV